MGFRWIQWDGVLLDSVGWGSARFSGMGLHWIQWDVVPPDSGGLGSTGFSSSGFSGMEFHLDSVGWGSTGFGGMGFLGLGLGLGVRGIGFWPCHMGMAMSWTASAIPQSPWERLSE